jgi:ribonuclease H / adenosylcobalamin/alpha-ribazole phosphatase
MMAAATADGPDSVGDRTGIDHVWLALVDAIRALSTGPSTGAPTRLLLVRHGSTGHTAAGRYSGRSDIPVTDDGANQASRVASRIAAAFRPVAVATSPLRRCRRTAEAIAAACGVDATEEPDLVECDFGAWDGHTFAEAARAWPAEHVAWLASTAVAPPGGESFDAVAARVTRFVERTRAGRPGADVVVVSHASPLKLLIRAALGAGVEALHRLVLDPGGLSIVEVWPDGGVAVPRINDTCHL